MSLENLKQKISQYYQNQYKTDFDVSVIKQGRGASIMIPKLMRTCLNISVGDKLNVRFTEDGEGFIVRPLKKSDN